MRDGWRLLVGLALAGNLVASAAPDATLIEGDKKLKSHEYKAALDLYQQALAKHPDDPDILLLASLASQGTGDVQSALKMLEHGHQVAPAAWTVSERLVLLYQDTGNLKAAETLADDLARQWDAGQDENLKATWHFLRDQFTDHGERYDVYRVFGATTSQTHHLYDFVQVNDQHKPQKIYYVEYNPFSKRYEFGLLAPGKNDNAYYGNSAHEPSYSDALQLFGAVWAGKILPSARPVTVMPKGMNPDKH